MPGATSGIGWNMNYPFNAGDLLCCGQTANNYLENNVKVGCRCRWMAGNTCRMGRESMQPPGGLEMEGRECVQFVGMAALGGGPWRLCTV
eukprot:1161047-Pelagomonas_calceolata.AAC.60